MTAEVELLLKITEEGDLEDTTKNMEDLSKSIEGLSADFVKLNPELMKNKDNLKDVLSIAGKLTPENKKYLETLKGQDKAQKKAAKSGKGLKGQLLGVAKGLVGISTAYAAGRALVKFAKDSLAAADAAGKLPPAFAEAEKASDRLKVSIGSLIGEVAGPGVSTFTDLKNSAADYMDQADILWQAYEQGIMTEQEYIELGEQINDGYITLAKAANDYAEQLNFTTDQERAMNTEREKALLLNEMYGAGTETLLEFLERIDSVAPVDMLAEVNPNIFSEMDRMRDKLIFLQGGGDKLAQKWTVVEENIGKSNLPLKDQLSIVTDLQLQAIELALSTDQMTLRQAISAARELGLSYQEAHGFLTANIAKMKVLDGMTADAYIHYHTTGGFSKGGMIKGQSGQVYNVPPVTGTAPTGGGQGPFQHGGSFRPGQFLVGEAGPEIVSTNVGGHVTSNKDIIDYDMLSSKIVQAIIGPMEDLTQTVVMAIG